MNKTLHKRVLYPFRLQDALLWWTLMLFSIAVLLWSGITGWVLDAEIKRIHEAGTVVSAQAQPHTLLPASVVTTSRLVVPLVGTATWVVGEPLTLQERNSERYYLCDARGHCVEVRGQPATETLTDWQTPQALGISAVDQQHSVPLDLGFQFYLWLYMFLMILAMKDMMNPFGPGKVEREISELSKQAALGRASEQIGSKSEEKEGAP